MEEAGEDEVDDEQEEAEAEVEEEEEEEGEDEEEMAPDEDVTCRGTTPWDHPVGSRVRVARVALEVAEERVTPRKRRTAQQEPEAAAGEEERAKLRTRRIEVQEATREEKKKARRLTGDAPPTYRLKAKKWQKRQAANLPAAAAVGQPSTEVEL